jgi:indole-3-glycerol phosphate synthase
MKSNLRVETATAGATARAIPVSFSRRRCVWSDPVPDKLDEIMAWKRTEIAPLARAVPESELARLDAALPRPPPFAAALRRPDGQLAVIAEIKRRSPSAGTIRAEVSAAAQALRYQAAGADALSVLTDLRYFGGELKDLRSAAGALRAGAPPSESDGGRAGASVPPCLRKDFMVHPIQVLQAREAGASAILIIVRGLPDEEIKVLHGAARAAGLEVLFEIHTEAELDRALAHGAQIIGVNNRDLAVMRTDLALSERLLPLFPASVVAVSESGISTGADAARARRAGAHAVLVGEALMRAAEPGSLLEELRTAAAGAQPPASPPPPVRPPVLADSAVRAALPAHPHA